ncbi:AMP-binding protein [Chloroflexota bacterium]
MRTIRNLIDRQSDLQPNKVFLIAPEPKLELTYKQLQANCQAFGNYLLSIGLSKNDKVSYMLHNGYQTALIFLGVIYSGFVITPINLLSQPAHLEYIVEHSDTKAIFTTEEQRDKLEAAISKAGRDIQLIIIDIDKEDIVSTEGPARVSLPNVSEKDPAQILYTSGTTGLPKGAVLTHKNLVAGGENTTAAHKFTEHDRALCSLPLYHINGQIVTIVAPLVHGGSVVMPHRFHTSNFWELISEFKCTWFSVVPTIMSYLLNATCPYGESKNLYLNQLRFGRSASAPLPQVLEKEFEATYKVPMIQTLGLTETAAPVFSNLINKKKYGSVGIPIGNEVKVVDEDGRILPPEQTGEIVVRGDNVMREYYKAPEITSSALINGWLHTGDCGYYDEDGYYFITGRLKEFIKKAGEKIAPAEIDAALYKHPLVLEAAAIGVPDDRYGQDIEACVVLKSGVQAFEGDIIDFCEKELGKFKTPKRITFMDALPKGPSGKIQRLFLRPETNNAIDSS